MLFPPSGYIFPPCIQSPEKSLNGHENSLHLKTFLITVVLYCTSHKKYAITIQFT